MGKVKNNDPLEEEKIDQKTWLSLIKYSCEPSHGSVTRSLNHRLYNAHIVGGFCQLYWAYTSWQFYAIFKRFKKIPPSSELTRLLSCLLLQVCVHRNAINQSGRITVAWKWAINEGWNCKTIKSGFVQGNCYTFVL